MQQPKTGITPSPNWFILDVAREFFDSIFCFQKILSLVLLHCEATKWDIRSEDQINETVLRQQPKWNHFHWFLLKLYSMLRTETTRYREKSRLLRTRPRANTTPLRRCRPAFSCSFFLLPGKICVLPPVGRVPRNQFTTQTLTNW